MAPSTTKAHQRLPASTRRRRLLLLGVGSCVLLATWAITGVLFPTATDRIVLPVRLASLRANDGESDDQTRTRIPRLIHQSWKSTTAIPSRFAPWMRSWVEHHPGWLYVYWSDADNLALFDKLYPKYAHVARRVGKIGLADMARYALLHRLGGLYADVDFECTKPFDQLHRDYDLFLSSEPRVHAILLEHHDKPALCNALMASVPNHPFWIQVLDAIHDAYERGLHHDNPVALTGPHMVKETYETYWETQAPTTTDVAVLAPEYFYPQAAQWNMPSLLNNCGQESSDPLVNEACAWLAQFPNGEFTNKTHACHHWQCTWCFGNDRDAMLRLSDVMRHANGAQMLIFKPYFHRATDGTEQLDLVNYFLS